MDSVTLSTKGQLVIPLVYRKALHLQPGDKVGFKLEGEKLVLQRQEIPTARLVMGKHRRRTLVSATGRLEMTPEFIRSLRDDE